MLGTLFQSIEKTPVTFKSWVAGFMGIVLVRVLLENLSSATSTGIIGSDASTFVHYSLFYLTVALSVMIILSVVLPKKRSVIPTIVLFGVLVIWFAPIVDLLMSGGEGYRMAYVFQSGSQLWGSFLTFFGPLVEPGVTIGIRTQVIVLLVGLFVYLRWSAVSIGKSISTIVLTYTVLFLLGSLPSVIGVIGVVVAGLSDSVFNIIALLVTTAEHSLIAQNFLHQTIALAPAERYQEIYFNVAISHVYYLLLTLLGMVWYYMVAPSKWIATLKNIRWSRALHFWSMLVLGGLLAHHFSPQMITWSWLDITGVIILFISFFCVWVFAVSVNDVPDKQIDAVSNAHRPLITGTLSVDDMRSVGLLLLLWSLVGGFLVGHYAFFMVLVGNGLAYIYSAWPLRLKRIPVVASFLMALGSLATVLAAFFTFSADKQIDAFPIQWVGIILLFYTLFFNIRDLKDIEGDRAGGIMTIPTMFRGNRGKHVVGAMFALAFLLLPNVPALWIPSLLVVIVGYWFCVRRRYVEWPLLALYFAYLLLAVVLILK